MKRVFPSKILLFGEYIVGQGSAALAIPYSRFSGQWHDKPEKSNVILSRIAEFIKEIEIDEFLSNYNYEKFNFDINNDLIFNSNIPIGYGIGSSGALVAAIYSEYFVNKTDKLSDLRLILGKIEDFFHKSSSGIDPLVSYLNKPIVIRGSNDIEIITYPIGQMKDYSLYLVNSDKIRSTGKFVEIFLNKNINPDFKNKYTEYQIELTNEIIESYLTNNEYNVFKLFQKISDNQYQYMPEMIVPEFKTIWKKTLDSSNAAMKLCGAGGGGFYLLITKSGLDLSDLLTEFEILQINPNF
jgi:mevalonate kinase